jgi:hypothetical protein
MTKKFKVIPATEAYMKARRLLRKVEEKLEDRVLHIRHKEAV